MSYIINPLGYRLTKTKFSKFCWVNLSKYNYKKNFFEDKNLDKFLLWFKFFLNWLGLNISILNFNIIKNYKFLNINIKILIRRNFYYMLKKKRKKKDDFALNYNLKFLKNDFFFKYILLYKQKKNNLFNQLKKKYSNVFRFFKKKKMKFNIKDFILNFFLFKKNKKNFKNYFLYSNFFLNVNYLENFNRIHVLSFYKKKIKKKKFLKFFIFFLKSFLLFFLNNVFYNKKIIINFFNQNEFFNSSDSLSNFIKMRVLQKYKVLHIVNLLFNNLLKKKNIIGIEIGLFGRYQKKLRNKKVWKLKGMISPSNINSPISYKNFVVLLRFGICGIKFYLLSKVYKNEIF